MNKIVYIHLKFSRNITVETCGLSKLPGCHLNRGLISKGNQGKQTRDQPFSLNTGLQFFATFISPRFTGYQLSISPEAMKCENRDFPLENSSYCFCVR